MVEEEDTLESSWPNCRWAVDISGWNPTDEEFQFVCSHLIRAEEGLHCKRFKFLDDRKRALVSLLLQRLVGALLLRSLVDSDCGSTVDPRKIEIGKTKGRKPYIDTTKPPFECLNLQNKDGEIVNFNYNVSHDGKFVVLAAETHCVCGCDISSTQSLIKKRKTTKVTDLPTADELKAFFVAFEKQLTDKEWEHVYSAGWDDTQQICARFCTYWSLKEAFAKALGLGLGYELGHVEFEIDDETGTAFARIHPDTDVSTDWCLYIHQIYPGHWVSVARGPPSAIVDAHGGFKKTLKSPELSREVLNAHVFQNRESPFLKVGVQNLINTYCKFLDSPENVSTLEEYRKRFHS